MKFHISGLAIALLMLPESHADDRESFDSIRSKLIQDRKKIESAHVILRSHNLVENRESLSEFWYDKNHIRKDQILDVKNAPSRRDILCVNCPKEGHFIQHIPSDSPLFMGAAVAQKIDNPKDKTLRIFDTRTLGLAERVLGEEADLEKVLAYPAEAKVERSDEEHAGSPSEVYLISLANRSASKKFWFSKKCNHSLTKIEMARTGGDLPIRASFECELEFYPEIQVWLPQTISYKSEAGSQSRNEKHEIQFDSINQQLDPKLFTLEGVNLPPQTVVVTRRPHQPYDIVNDDGKITKLNPKTMQPSPPEEPRTSRAKTVLLGTGLILMMIVAIRLIRKNRSGAASGSKTEKKPDA